MLTQDDVLYMIVTDRFAVGDPAHAAPPEARGPESRHGGDLLGIVRRFPYLKELGVTALWLTPVYPNPPHGYHGYFPTDFETVDAQLASPELSAESPRAAYVRFVELAREAGFKVVFDAIVNHTAHEHPWRQERPEWYNDPQPTLEKHWVWGLPDLNHDRLDVNLYFTLNVLDWMSSTGVDGVRIDAARHVESEFWSLFKLFSQGLCPTTTVLGEVWDERVEHVAPFQTLHGFGSMFDFPFQAAAAAVFAEDAPFTRIARPELWSGEPEGILNMDQAYRNAYQLVTFLENHDLPRFLHRAGGEERPEEALARYRLALLFLFTTRGIPQLYYGSELGMPGGVHPDNRRDMPWAWIDGPEEGSPEAARAHALFHWTRDLVRLRRGSQALRYGLLVTLYVTPTVYAFARVFPGDARVVVLNNHPEPVELHVPLQTNPRLPAGLLERLPEGTPVPDDLSGATIRLVGGGLPVRLPGRSGAVYRVGSGEW